MDLVSRNERRRSRAGSTRPRNAAYQCTDRRAWYSRARHNLFGPTAPIPRSSCVWSRCSASPGDPAPRSACLHAVSTLSTSALPAGARSSAISGHSAEAACYLSTLSAPPAGRCMPPAPSLACRPPPALPDGTPHESARTVPCILFPRATPLALAPVKVAPSRLRLPLFSAPHCLSRRRGDPGTVIPGLPLVTIDLPCLRVRSFPRSPSLCVRPALKWARAVPGRPHSRALAAVYFARSPGPRPPARTAEARRRSRAKLAPLQTFSDGVRNPVRRLSVH